MEYYLFEDQQEGCGHTIGCGLRLRKLQSTNFTAACDEAESQIPTEGEFAVKKAMVLEVSRHTDLDITRIREAELNRRRLEQLKEQTDQEQAEYKRLKRKFEKRHTT